MQNHESIFSGHDLSALEAEAERQGVSLDSLVTQLVKSELYRRYRNPSIAAAQIVPFGRRKTDPQNFPVTQNERNRT